MWFGSPFFKGKGKEEHVKECIRPESLITPRFIRKLSTGRTRPTIYIKVTNEVDETGAYYTEQSKSERKTPIQYINAYIWNIERR